MQWEERFEANFNYQRWLSSILFESFAYIDRETLPSANFKHWNFFTVSFEFLFWFFFLFISQRNSEWHSILIRLKRIANPSCLKAIAKKNSTIQFHLISVLSFRKWLLCARETNKMTAAHTSTHAEKKIPWTIKSMELAGKSNHK